MATVASRSPGQAAADGAGGVAVDNPMKGLVPYAGKSAERFPHVPSSSDIPDGHDGAWGGSEKNKVGRRVFLRMDFEQARSMEFAVIGSIPDGKTNEHVLAATSRAEFYTANGALAPGTLASADAKDITAQGWILKKALEKDTNACKTFRLAQPGKFNQVLLVWDGLGVHPMPQNWGRLELFGSDGLAERKDKWRRKFSPHETTPFTLASFVPFRFLRPLLCR